MDLPKVTKVKKKVEKKYKCTYDCYYYLNHAKVTCVIDGINKWRRLKPQRGYHLCPNFDIKRVDGRRLASYGDELISQIANKDRKPSTLTVFELEILYKRMFQINDRVVYGIRASL